ncbi:hypothetical protein BOTBODRAFT_305661 [Botryobasidium botryosum FD-172 SS1]|uniref:Uncharacterized protein n=1 Tax=Botryobasidium botryosum (strain FD-172 SS1) TaxID=930990 RepID=A0A067MXC2_BOTB1|nr:hypothetical protein BOTBODRAFT_305661 [Botryobasidium botryosum FD-172 SS1]
MIGFPGSRHKTFSALEDAEAWIISSTPMPTPQKPSSYFPSSAQMHIETPPRLPALSSTFGFNTSYAPTSQRVSPPPESQAPAPNPSFDWGVDFIPFESIEVSSQVQQQPASSMPTGRYIPVFQRQPPPPELLAQAPAPNPLVSRGAEPGEARLAGRQLATSSPPATQSTRNAPPSQRQLPTQAFAQDDAPPASFDWGVDFIPYEPGEVLSDEQQEIFDLVRSGQSVFFTGSAGMLIAPSSSVYLGLKQAALLRNGKVFSAEKNYQGPYWRTPRPPKSCSYGLHWYRCYQHSRRHVALLGRRSARKRTAIDSTQESRRECARQKTVARGQDSHHR